jgi:myo-inositol-1(or 4)-monophosphatase
MSNWQPFLDTAVEAARIAGRFQRYRFTSLLDVALKGDKDLVTEIDRESERLIVAHLLGSFPDHGIIAEEGEYLPGTADFRWIIDPLDGTTNYAHGFPWFCVSIGLEAAGELVAGVIYNPMHEELFTATASGGSFLNGQRLYVSSRGPLQNTLLGTGFPYDCASDQANNFDDFIAYVAAGRLDGFWELKLKPWDVAAGVLLVREAGGTVTTFDGTGYDIFNNRIVASNGLIHEEMTRMLTRGAHEPQENRSAA